MQERLNRGVRNRQMVNRFQIGLMAVLLLALSACNSDQKCLKADGQILEKHIELAPFTSLQIDINAQVFLRQDTALDLYRIQIDAQENILDKIGISREDKTIRFFFEQCIKRHGEVRIYLDVADLNELILSGPGRVETEEIFRTRFLNLSMQGQGDVDLVLETEAIRTTVIGSGNAQLSGAARFNQVVMLGSGEVESFNLIADTVLVQVGGTGQSQVYALDWLRVINNGDGNVRYRGEPDIEASGIGSARIIDSNL